MFVIAGVINEKHIFGEMPHLWQSEGWHRAWLTVGTDCTNEQWWSFGLQGSRNFGWCWRWRPSESCYKLCRTNHVARGGRTEEESLSVLEQNTNTLLPKVIPREQTRRGPSVQNHTTVCFVMCFGSAEESDDTLDKHCIVTWTYVKKTSMRVVQDFNSSFQILINMVTSRCLKMWLKYGLRLGNLNLLPSICFSQFFSFTVIIKSFEAWSVIVE